MRRNFKYYIYTLILAALFVIVLSRRGSEDFQDIPLVSTSLIPDTSLLKSAGIPAISEIRLNDEQDKRKTESLDLEITYDSSDNQKDDVFYPSNEEIAELPPAQILKSTQYTWYSSIIPYYDSLSVSRSESFNPEGFADHLQNVLLTGTSDALSFVSNPLKWDKQDYLKLGIIASGTLLLYTVDNEIHKTVTNGGTPSSSGFIKFGEFYGRTITTELTSLSITAYGLLWNDHKAMQLGLELYESYIIANNITAFIKYSFGRSRPSSNEGPYSFSTFEGSRRLSAFPSGHSTLAFSMSTILASYTDDYHLKLLIYLPAFLTAFSRVYENYHWTSDVFLGAAIGHFVGSFIASRHNPFKRDGIEFGMDQEGRPGIKISF